MSARPISSYVELSVPPPLTRFVSCLWVHRVTGDGDSYVHPVHPDASADIVSVADRPLVLVGPATGTSTVDLVAGSVSVGVRFRPGAAPSLIGTSARDVADRDVGLDDLWGSAGAELADRVVAAGDWRSRLRLVVQALMRRQEHARDPDVVGVEVPALLARDDERPLRELAADVGLGERQLRRRVEDAIGYSPRMLRRVLRFQRFLRAARRAGRQRGLARLAVEAGYADQAHLTRECRQLGGLPPGALFDWEATRASGRPERSRPNELDRSG